MFGTELTARYSVGKDKHNNVKIYCFYFHRPYSLVRKAELKWKIQTHRIASTDRTMEETDKIL